MAIEIEKTILSNILFTNNNARVQQTHYDFLFSYSLVTSYGAGSM